MKWQCRSCKFRTKEDLDKCPECRGDDWKRIPKKKLSKKGKKRMPKRRIPIPPQGSRHKSVKDYKRKPKHYQKPTADDVFLSKFVKDYNPLVKNKKALLEYMRAMVALKSKPQNYTLPEGFKITAWGPGVDAIREDAAKEPTMPTFDSYICHECQKQVGFCMCTMYVDDRG
jgi:hypothetical protein